MSCHSTDSQPTARRAQRHTGKQSWSHDEYTSTLTPREHRGRSSSAVRFQCAAHYYSEHFPGIPFHFGPYTPLHPSFMEARSKLQISARSTQRRRRRDTPCAGVLPRHRSAATTHDTMLRPTTILALAALGAAFEANYPYTHTNCGVRRTGSRTLDSKNPNLLA